MLSRSCLFRQCLSVSRGVRFFSLSPDGCVSARPPTGIPDRECFCPLQAENWPNGADAKHGRRRVSPFSAFRGSARSIIIITGSPIKLRGSSSAGEPTPMRTHTRSRHRGTRSGEPGTGFARRRSTPKACHDAPRSCARPDKPLLKRNSHGSPLYTVDNAIQPSRSKK